MKLMELLRADTSVTSVVGSGGKSTLINELARELGGSVIVTTTTHMLAPAGCPLLIDPTENDIDEALGFSRVICVGSRAGEGEKIAAPKLSISTLAVLADCVLVEADGSRQLPLKGHASYEPVIPEESEWTIQVVGASGFGGRVSEVVHRPEIFCELAGCELDDVCTPELYAKAVAEERKRGVVVADTIVVNQADDQHGIDDAARFAESLRELGVEVPVAAGSIREHRICAL